MPGPDTESHLLVAALEARGIAAEIRAWDARCDWAAVSLVVVRSTWDYVDRLGQFLAWADHVESVARLANSAAVLRWNTHKSYLIELARQGVATVPTRILTRDTGQLDLSGLFAGAAELVVKPAVSIGAVGARKGAAGEPALVEHATNLLQRGDVLVQPFVGSVVEQGETSLMFAGSEHTHAVRKVPAARDYRVQDHLGGSVHRHRPTPAELAVARAALAAAPESCLYARVDLVHTDDGPVVMELELTEPTLFLDEDPLAAERFADAVAAHLRSR